MGGVGGVLFHQVAAQKAMPGPVAQAQPLDNDKNPPLRPLEQGSRSRPLRHSGRWTKTRWMRPAAAPPRLLVSEDFKQTPPGGPPKGWEGDAFSVVPDKSSRACLEVNKSAGYFYLTLPRMALTGDFYIDAEVLMDGRVGCSDQHQMTLVLEGRGGAVRGPVWVNSDGGVLIGKDGQWRKPPNYSPYQITRLRVAREKNNFQVSLNGEVATGTPLDNTIDFDTVWIGLPAGLCPYNRTLGTNARIYSVRVGLPGPARPPCRRPCRSAFERISARRPSAPCRTAGAPARAATSRCRKAVNTMRWN